MSTSLVMLGQMELHVIQMMNVLRAVAMRPTVDREHMLNLMAVLNLLVIQAT